MKDIKVEFSFDEVNKDILFTASGKDLVYNANNFFGVNSFMTWIPKEQVRQLIIQLTQLDTDMVMREEISDGKAGEELRDLAKIPPMNEVD
jgi:hypothetical protein